MEQIYIQICSVLLPHSLLGYLRSFISSKDSNQPLRLAVVSIILRWL